MTERLFRYADLLACQAVAFHTRTSDPHEKEDFIIIGPGASNRHAHMCQPHGFQIGAVRQEFGYAESQHSCDTAEVFVVHSGQWRLFFGPNQEDGSIDLAPGDVFSVPCRIFRGVAKLDEGKGFLWTPRGQDQPNDVSWRPAVFAAAADRELRLAKGGRLIDTSSGNYQLRDLASEPTSNAMDHAELDAPPLEKLQSCCVRAAAMAANPHSPLAADGVAEAGVIATRRTRDGFMPGPIAGWWPHGFTLRRLTLASGAYVPLHARQEAEVLFVQQGTFEVSWNEGAILMGAGDTLSVPVDLPHALRNTASVPAEVFIVRGTEDPAMPAFSSVRVPHEQVSAPAL